MGGRGGGRGGNMYSQVPTRGGFSKVHRPISDARNISELAGSAQFPNMPVSKKCLVHNNQEFANRPKTFVFDKPAVGIKTELFTNHALVRLPKTTVKMFVYCVVVSNNNKPLLKREEASPLFYEVIRNGRGDRLPRPSSFIFNDVNTIWTMKKFEKFEGNMQWKRAKVSYKHTGCIDLGEEIREDQDKQITATLVDAIATARCRNGNGKYIVFKRNMFMIQDSAENNEILYDHPLTIPIGHGNDARLGVSIGIKLNLRAGVTACYDVAHTIFNRPGYPLIRLLCELINAQPIRDEDFENIWDGELRRAVVTQQNRMELDRILKKMKLRYTQESAVRFDATGKVTHQSSLKTNNIGGKQFKYYELSPTSAEQYFFKDDSGNRVSIANYYLSRNIRLRYPNLPCLVKKPVRGHPVIAFPMEFVTYIAEPKRFEGYVSERVKTAMITETNYTAPQRRQLLEHIIGQRAFGDVPPAVDNNDVYMREHGLSIEKEMLTVKATVLPPPTVVYGEGSTFKDEKHMGEWEAITHNPIRKVLDGAAYVKGPEGQQLKKRLVGSIMHVLSPESNTPLDYDPARYHRIMRAIESSGQPVAWDHEEYGHAAIQGTYEFCQGVHPPHDIYKFFQKLRDNVDEKFKKSEDEQLIPFVLVVFQVRCTNLVNNRSHYYNDYNFIKHLAENEIGIYTQCILVNNLNHVEENPAGCKLTRLIVEKVLGKIGTTHRKLEREGDHKSWTRLTDPKEPTLVLGVDVCHPSPKERSEEDIRKLSVATVVGNIDVDCTEFRASSRLQETGEENIVRFKDEISARICDFVVNTQSRPKHIVVYRDGICEGDFQRILYEEKRAILDCCADIEPDYKPTITYIVVSKRHHTRFFLKNESEGHVEHGHNVLPGTLVEDTVTTTDYYDFFLTTQVGQKGVAHPTHYYVLYDDWKPFVSFWPTVTHAFTYMFCRTTSTVSLPAPVLYAHLAAKRAKESLDGAWELARMENRRLSVDNYADVHSLTRSINTNLGLNGMTFV